MRLFRVVMPVREIEAGVAFYATLLGAAGERVAPTRHYFECGGTLLALVQPFDHERDEPAPAAAFRPNPEHVYFAVADLAAAHARAGAAGGLELDATIATQPWGERSFYLRDPFGNPLCSVDEATLFSSAGSQGGADRSVGAR